MRTTRGCLRCTSWIRRAVRGSRGAGAARGVGSARRVRTTRGCLRRASSIRCAVRGDGGAGAARGVGTGSSGDAGCQQSELLRSPDSGCVSLLSSLLAPEESECSVLEEEESRLLETSGLSGSVAVMRCISSCVWQLFAVALVPSLVTPGRSCLCWGTSRAASEKARTSPRRMMAAFPQPLGAGSHLWGSPLRSTVSPSIQVSKRSISTSSLSSLWVLGVSSGKGRKCPAGQWQCRLSHAHSVQTPPQQLCCPSERDSPLLIHVSRSSMSASSYRMPVLDVTSGKGRKCPVGQCQLSFPHPVWVGGWVPATPRQLCCPQTHRR